MNDDFLNQLNESPRPEFVASLYQRISKNMLTQPNVLFRRRLALTFTGAIVLVTIVLAVSPNARALAAEILRKVGVLTFDSRPAGEPVIFASPLADQLASDDSDMSAKISPVFNTMSPEEQLAESDAIETPITMSLETAIAEAGFPPFLPGDLPEGYSQVSIFAAEVLDYQLIGYGKVIIAEYRSEAGGYLSITTSRFGREQSIATGGLSVTEVTVNGQPGVWIEGGPLPSDLWSGISTLDMLVWQEGDFVLSIEADQLALEEVLKIAEGLKK